MALRQADLILQVTGSATVVSIKPYFFDPLSTVLIQNGSTLIRNTDYTEGADRQSLTFAVAPPLPATTSLVCYFNDDLFSPLPPDFDTATLQANYLFGLDLKDQMGRALPNQVLVNKLMVAIAQMQRELRDFSITPQVIKSSYVLGLKCADGSWSQPPEIAAIEAADLFEDPYDYDINDYINWGFMVLRRKPIISVERVRLIYPTGQTIIQYPPEWIKMYKKPGQFQIVPMAGSFNQYPLIGQGAMYLPLMSGFLTKSVPQLIHVDYTAGLEEIPDDLKDAIYKLAAIQILLNAGQGKAPGVASLSTSADGLSENTTLTQSANTTLYGAQIKEYRADVKQFIVDFLENQKGIDFRVA